MFPTELEANSTRLGRRAGARLAARAARCGGEGRLALFLTEGCRRLETLAYSEGILGRELGDCRALALDARQEPSDGEGYEGLARERQYWSERA